MRQDNVGREPDQFRGVSASFLGVAFGPAHVDADVASNDPPGLRQRLLERPEPSLKVCIICGDREKHADAPYALSLLPPRRERPGYRRAAEERDEGASSHSMTSSARASRVAGTVRPSAFAVLRLITSSYLVGAWTGRSLGFSPLRMRSTYPAARRTTSCGSGPYEIRPPSTV